MRSSSDYPPSSNSIKFVHFLLDRHFPILIVYTQARKGLKAEREKVQEGKRQEQARLEQQRLHRAARAAEAKARSLRPTVAEEEKPTDDVIQYNGARSSRLQKMKLPTYIEPTERGLGYEGEPDDLDEDEKVVHVRTRIMRSGKPSYEDDEEDYSETIEKEEDEEPEEEREFEPESQQVEEEIATVAEPKPMPKLVKKRHSVIESDESSAGEESDESEEEVVAPKMKMKKRAQILDSEDEEEMRAKPKKKQLSRRKPSKRDSDFSSLSELSDDDEDDLLPAHTTSKVSKKKSKANLDNFIVSDSDEGSQAATESEASE